MSLCKKNILKDWTINYNQNDKEQFIIGYNLDNDKIISTEIDYIIDITGKYIDIQTLNCGCPYRLYFNEYFDYAYENKVLYDWDLKYDKNSFNVYITGFRNAKLTKYWTTTKITRYENYGVSFKIYTESGSTYILYIEDNCNKMLAWKLRLTFEDDVKYY